MNKDCGWAACTPPTASRSAGAMRTSSTSRAVAFDMEFVSLSNCIMSECGKPLPQYDRLLRLNLGISPNLNPVHTGTYRRTGPISQIPLPLLIAG